MYLDWLPRLFIGINWEYQGMPGLPFPISEFFAGLVPDTTLEVRLYRQLLFVSDFPAPSDFSEATYNGYQRQDVIIGPGPQKLATGYVYFETQPMLFRSSESNRSSDVINGWYMVARGGSYSGRVVAWGSITPPQPFSNPGVTLSLVPCFTVISLVTP
jgi:hypothetical protein